MNSFTTTIMISTLAFGYQLANPAPSQDAPSVIVHFADLDITHGDGVYRRLKSAAETGLGTRSKLFFQMVGGTGLEPVTPAV